MITFLYGFFWDCRCGRRVGVLQGHLSSLRNLSQSTWWILYLLYKPRSQGPFLYPVAELPLGLRIVVGCLKEWKVRKCWGLDVSNQLKKVKAELELFLCCMTKSSSLPHQPKTRNAKTRELPPNHKACGGFKLNPSHSWSLWKMSNGTLKTVGWTALISLRAQEMCMRVLHCAGLGARALGVQQGTY